MNNPATKGREPDDQPDDLPKEPNDLQAKWFISDQELKDNPRAIEDKQIEMQLAGTMSPEAVRENKPEGLLQRIWGKISNVLGLNKTKKAVAEPNNVVPISKTNNTPHEKPLTNTENTWFAKPGESLDEARDRFEKGEGYRPELTEGSSEKKKKVLEPLVGFPQNTPDKKEKGPESLAA